MLRSTNLRQSKSFLLVPRMFHGRGTHSSAGARAAIPSRGSSQPRSPVYGARDCGACGESRFEDGECTVPHPSLFMGLHHSPFSLDPIRVSLSRQSGLSWFLGA